MRGYVVKKGKNYYAVVYEGIDPGTGKERRRWHAAGPRRSDAEKLVNDLVRRKQQGDDTASDRSTLGAYLVDRWLPLQESRLRATTYRSYQDAIHLHVIPRIGKLRLDKLQADDLEGLYVDLLRNGRRNGAGGGLSPTSVRYIHRVVHKALVDAHRKGIVARNVAALADSPQPKANGPKTRIRVWAAADLKRFLAATADHFRHPLWVVAAHTGMRRGELLGLRWTDIDLDAATISVHQAIVVVAYAVHVSDAKTASGRRTINIDERTVKVLRDLHAGRFEAENSFDPQSLVFPNPSGTPLHPELVSRNFDRLVAKHRLPPIRFHDLRHTHATLLLKAGVPVKVVSERLGHATPGFTLNIYQHVLPGMQAEAADIFGRLLQGDL